MIDTFRSRLVLSNLLISLLGLAVVVVIFTFLLAGRSTEIRVQDLRAQSRTVAERIHVLYANRAGPRELKHEVDLASQMLEDRIIIINPAKQVVVDSRKDTPFFKGSRYQYSLNALEGARSAQSVLASPHLMGFQSPIKAADGRTNGGAVLLLAQVADVRPGLSSLLPAILGLAGVAFLVWLLIGIFFTFSLSRPLSRIIGATERMAGGDYKVRVTEQGSGEIALLGRRFNDMARRVQESSQILRDFVANVSHDLRTPLTLVTGFSQALLDGTADSAEVGAAAQVINDEAARMQHLVDDLLQLTRLESGLLTLAPEPVEIHSFVEHVIAGTRRAHPEAPFIDNQVGEALPLMEVDPVRMERVLRNLLDNAIQYTPSAGSIAVGARPAGRDRVELSVADTGDGIPAEDLPRVFERFYRADKSRERSHGHSGLGLAIVRQIVEAHGGKASVAGGETGGSIFRITVPRARSPRTTARAQTASAQASPSPSPSPSPTPSQSPPTSRRGESPPSPRRKPAPARDGK